MNKEQKIKEVSFQVVHNIKEIEKHIIKYLKEAYDTFETDSSYIEKTDKEIENLVEIKYNKKIGKDKKKLIAGFNILITGNYEEVLENFINNINEDKNCIALIKLKDDTIVDTYKKYYEEILSIEMQLREILFFIFYEEFPDNPYSLLTDYEIKTISKPLQADALKEKLENQFFYLSFSDYGQLDNPKKIKNIEEINKLLKQSESFENFKKSITERGIIDSNHIGFLKSLKNNMNSIEKARNAMAHNRAISDKTNDNYEKSKSELEKKLKEFWTD
jgi:hypothetical protein